MSDEHVKVTAKFKLQSFNSRQKTLYNMGLSICKILALISILLNLTATVYKTLAVKGPLVEVNQPVNYGNQIPNMLSLSHIAMLSGIPCIHCHSYLMNLTIKCFTCAMQHLPMSIVIFCSELVMYIHIHKPITNVR